MKTCIKKLRLIPALIGALGLILAGQATAEIFTNIYTFTALSVPYTGTNQDGSFPEAGLLLSGNTLYGTTYYGGTSARGTVFRVNTDGKNFITLHNFSAGATNSLGVFTNSDGGHTVAGLIISGNTLYGTAQYGGTAGRGTVFRVNTDGSGFTNLHNFPALLSPFFTNSDGGNPQAGLVLSGATLYGTAMSGGNRAHGTVFGINTDGTGFTNLHNFTSIDDGGNPVGGLVLSGATLYGTASIGGNYVSGTVFKVSTNGTDFTNVYTFTATGEFIFTNSDGAQPFGTLVLSGDTLYGTTGIGGSAGMGTVFAVNTNGTGFTNLHTFTGGDGANQFAGLTLAGNTLFGTTQSGGSSGQGTVFRINTNGTGFGTLHNFGGLGGAYPQSGLVITNTTLYGTGTVGGGMGSGTVFALFIQPQLAITRV